MIVSCIAFSTMWVLIRFASHDVHAFVIVFFRNAIGTLVLVPMMVRNKGLMQLSRMRANGARATSGFIATTCTFYAVSHAPMATALSINYTAPLFATAGAVLFLGEKIHARRIAALIVGFAGMLIVVRPGALPPSPEAQWLSPGVLAAMVSAVSTAFSIIAIRKLVATDDSRAVAAWTFILMTPPSLVMAAFFWTTPPPQVWPILFAIGCVAAIGQLSMNRAFALAETSAVLPYDFVRFGLVTLAGITLFDERLDALTVIGGIVIFGATIYLAVRERQVAKREVATRLPGDS